MAFEITRLYLAALVFVLAWGIAQLISKHAWQLRLVQTPNERSSHTKPTPSGGGISIAIAGFCGSVALVPSADMFTGVAIVSTLLAAILGLLDDRFDLPSRLRIIVHVLIVGAILAALGRLPAIPTPLGELPMPILYAVALLAGVWWINLFNFMDGIDGIAASQATFLCIGMVFLSATSVGSAQSSWLEWWAITLATASGGFLIVNWAPARIFMGDAGSNYLAVAIFVVAAGLVASNTLFYGTVLVLGATFITDATLTLVTRVLRGERWATAHRLHAYQKLSRRWGKHSLVTLLYMAFNIVWLFPIAYFIQARQGNLLLILLAYGPAIVFCFSLGAGKPDRQLRTEKGESDD